MDTQGQILTYQAMSDEIKKLKLTKNLLLGNGFSMALCHSNFNYNSLNKYITNSANFDVVDNLKLYEEMHNDTNLEGAMEFLEYTAELMEIFNNACLPNLALEEGSVKSTLDTIGKIRRELILSVINACRETLKVNDLSSKSCWHFIKSIFNSQHSMIFTTNYDCLLPYEIDMHPVRRFHADKKQIEINVKEKVFFLHGAIHLFFSDAEYESIPYNDKTKTDRRQIVLEEIKQRINSNKFPIYVANSSYMNKMNEIKRDKYLSIAYKNFLDVRGALIIFGLKFSNNDNHLIEAINLAASNNFQKTDEEKLKKVYLSYYNDDDLRYLKSIKGKFKCDIAFYNAHDIKIWE